IIIFSIYLLYLFFTNSDYKIISIAQILLVISSLFDINWFFFGLEKFKLTIRRNLIVKILTVLFIFIFVKKEEDLLIYTVIISGGILISQLVLWPYLFKEVNWVKPYKREIFSHIKPNLILFIPVVSVSLYKLTSKIMLGSLTDMVELGYYENAEKINSVQISISTALGTVMLPRMSNLISSNNRQQFKKVFR